MLRLTPALVVSLALATAWRPGAAQPSGPAVAGPVESSRVATNAAFQVEVTGRGRPMLLIPGFTSPGRVWASTVDAFRDRFECHVFTLAGFAGQPAIADSAKLVAWRDAIVRYIRERRLDRPVIVGHSLGGFLALDIAQAYPDLPRAVVNVDGLPFLPAATMATATAESMQPMARQMRTGMTRSDSTQFAAQLLMSLRQMIRDTTQIPGVYAASVRSDQATSGEAYYELMTTDLRPLLPRITAPVLNVHVWRAYAPYGQTRVRVDQMLAAQYRGLARQETVVHDEAYHFVMLDEPEWLHEAMRAFLSGAGR